MSALARWSRFCIVDDDPEPDKQSLDVLTDQLLCCLHRAEAVPRSQG